ncbi:TPR domain protein [Candidatus Sulfopaludibacter sp. SbA4]|nr:TPR domain protein [Candidatus Sulfopaludibacter sp. SbA4]
MRIPAVVSVFLIAASVSAFSQAPTKQQQIESHSRQAQEFLRTNQPDLAVREFNSILELDPNNVDARGNLGVTLFFKGDYAKAAPHLRAAVKQRPNLWKIEALLGMSERRIGQTAAAQADLEKSFPQLQEEKLRIQAGMELIEIYYGAGNLDKAASIAGVLRQLAPTNTDVLYTAYRIYSDLVGESTLTMAMLAPKSARMHQVMAQEMARQGNTEGAIAHYREAVKLDPQLPGLRFELAEALNLSSSAADQEQVEKEYQAALSDNPFDEKAECRLGDIALRASELESALAHYTRALELQPNDAEACLGIGKTLTQMHRPAEAEPYLKRSAQLEPFNAATHYRLSLVYRAAGRTADAQKELAEFQRLKDMKERLKQVYEEMRLQPVKQERPETDIAK